MMAMTVQASNCDTHANGCSIPFGCPFIYKETFTPSCNRHDMCYGCGADYGISKDDCDTNFLHEMTKACFSARRRRLISRDKRNICSSMATTLYYEAAHWFGQSHFEEAGKTETYCAEAWVQSCLPPSTRRR
ncbi:hypothetical protein ACOMHN_007830 [Nucella lapillus]